MKQSLLLGLGLITLCDSALGAPLPELQPVLGKRGKLVGFGDFE